MADVKIIGVPCIDSCLNSLEGDLSKYVDEGYIITGQCITPQGNIIYTLVKNTEENKIVPVPAPTLKSLISTLLWKRWKLTGSRIKLR